MVTPYNEQLRKIKFHRQGFIVSYLLNSNLSQLIYIMVNQFGSSALENNKTKLNKRRSKVTSFKMFLIVS